MRGAGVGRKVSLGAHCTVDRPWCIRLGERVLLEQGVYLKPVSNGARLVIGGWSFLGKGVEIDCEGSIQIGEHVLLSPGCFITDHNHSFTSDRRIDQQECVVEAVSIGDDAWIGANAVILPGVNIGKGAVVGAGAVVTADVGGNDVVAGVPAQVIGHR